MMTPNPQSSTKEIRRTFLFGKKMYRLFISLTLLLGTIATDFSILDEISNSVVSETYLFVGEDFKLTCTLPEMFRSQYTADKISIFYEHPFQAGSLRCISASYVQAENETTALMTIPDVTVNDAGAYICFVGKEHCNNSDTVGFSHDIVIEYPPHNVTDFQCVVYNWDVLECTWQHPVNYVNWSNIRVTSSYAVTTSNRQYPCPDLSVNGCKWNNENYRGDDLVVLVTVTNSFKFKNTSKVFQVRVNSIVKPAPVEGLTSNQVDDKLGCLMLTWMRANDYKDRIYRVKHRSLGEEDFKILTDDLNETSYTSCGHGPYTHHNFSVETLPVDIFSGFWSDPVYTEAVTAMTAPTFGPRTTNGSFTTSRCIKGQRNVTVMWQDVDVHARNGIIDHYLIKNESGASFEVKATEHQATLELSCSIATRVMIFARNRGGISLNPSILVISPDSFIVPDIIKESFAVEVMPQQYDNDQEELLRAWWEIDEGSPTLNYTIFWCEGLPGRQCENMINWAEVVGTQTHFDIPVLAKEAMKTEFGISVTYSGTGMASKIFWTECLFRRNLTSLEPVKGLQVEDQVESVRVYWNRNQCTYRNMIRTTGYRIKFCQEKNCNNSESIMSIEVPASASSYTISSMTANTRYNLTIQSISDGNAGVEVTPWKKVRPKADDASEWPWSVLGIIAVLVTTIIVIFFIYIRWCKPSMNRLKYLSDKEVFFVDIPNVEYASGDEPPAPAATSNMVNVNTTPPTAGPSRKHREDLTNNVEMAAMSPGTVSSSSSEVSFLEEEMSSKSRLIKPKTTKRHESHGASRQQKLQENNISDETFKVETEIDNFKPLNQQQDGASETPESCEVIVHSQTQDLTSHNEKLYSASSDSLKYIKVTKITDNSSPRKGSDQSLGLSVQKLTPKVASKKMADPVVLNLENSFEMKSSDELAEDYSQVALENHQSPITVVTPDTSSVLGGTEVEQDTTFSTVSTPLSEASQNDQVTSPSDGARNDQVSPSDGASGNDQAISSPPEADFFHQFGSDEDSDTDPYIGFSEI